MPRKDKPASFEWRAIEDAARPELFQVKSSTGEVWKAHLIIDGGMRKRTQFPLVKFMLQRWRATRHMEKRTFHLCWWFGEDRLVNGDDVVTLREMDEALCEAVEDKFLQGGERMIGDAVKSLGDDLSFLGWVRILLPRGCEGWSAWDMPERQGDQHKEWVNAMVITPDGLPFQVGWSRVQSRWAFETARHTTRLREECPEELLEKVAQYLCEEYTPHLQQHDEVA